MHTTSSSRLRHRRLSQRGVSLVEVMVGLVIGLVASLVIVRSFSASETFRRNIGGVADTVQTAAISGARLGMLFEEGGASFVRGRNVWGCKLVAKRNKATLLPAGSAFAAPFAAFPTTVRVLPVGILDGGDAASDIVMVMSGSSAAGNRDMPLNGTPPPTDKLTFLNPNGIAIANAGTAVDDLFLIVPQEVAAGPGDCQIVQAASDYSGGAPKTDASLGLSVMPAMAEVVGPASYTDVRLNVDSASFGPIESTAGSPSAFHLGREAASTFSLVSVNANGELVELDLLQRRGAQSFGENVVLFKARYGVDNGVGGTANDNAIDEWIAPSEAGWTLASLMDGTSARAQRIDQIKAIRIGLVVRSPQVVATGARLTQIELFGDLSGSRKITRDLTKDEQRYAYQVFDWVIPLRNMKSVPK